MTHADAIWLGGTLLTVDAHDRTASAVAVRDGRIIAVGSEAETRSLAGPGTRVIDLEGDVLVPGFVDAHSHLGMVGEREAFWVQLESPPVGVRRTMADIVAAFRERAEQTPEGRWILGTGYDDTLLAEMRHPDRRDLDAATTHHPVLALHVSGHLAAANSCALELSGVTAASPQPEGGHIQKDSATGEPTGVLEEGSAIRPFYERMDAQPPAERVAAIVRAGFYYARRGVTTAQDGAAELRRVRDLAAASRSGALPIRVMAWPSYVAWKKIRAGAPAIEGVDPERMWLGAVKYFADGSIQGYTGHLCCPYHVPGDHDARYRGYASMTRETLADQITEAWRTGSQVAVHVNGDAAIDDFLFAIEEAQKRAPRDDARPIAVHAQMTREDQLEKMAELGVVPSFFVLHTYYWGDRHRDVFIGPERAARISPTRSAATRGLRFTVHTDAPVVPMDPLRLMWSAVNRVTTGGQVLGGEQCLTPREALRAVTIDPAWQAFREADLGSIEVGKCADFARLSGNPLDQPEQIAEIEVRGTWVGGEAVV